MSDFNWEVGKTYKTRGGWDAVVLSLEGPAKWPLVARHDYNKEYQRVQQHYADGSFHGDSEVAPHDLMPPKREFFIVYDKSGRWYSGNECKQIAFDYADDCSGKVIRFIEDGEVTK